MKRSIRLTIIIIAIAILFPTCFKDANNTQTCLITSVIRNERKIVMTYSAGKMLIGISDYSDSANILTLNQYDLFYNINGYLSSVNLHLETGVWDSLAFDYTVNSRVKQRLFTSSANGYVLNNTRSYVLDNNGYISSDTTWDANNLQKGSAAMLNFSTYQYDDNQNLKTFRNYNPNGSINFSMDITYSNTSITNTSFHIAKFTAMDKFMGSYQFLFPTTRKLPSKIVFASGGSSWINDYTYTYNSDGDVIVEDFTSSSCDGCTTTTQYNYRCR